MDFITVPTAFDIIAIYFVACWLFPRRTRTSLAGYHSWKAQGGFFLSAFSVRDIRGHMGVVWKYNMGTSKIDEFSSFSLWTLYSNGHLANRQHFRTKKLRRCDALHDRFFDSCVTAPRLAVAQSKTNTIYINLCNVAKWCKALGVIEHRLVVPVLYWVTLW